MDKIIFIDTESTGDGTHESHSILSIGAELGAKINGVKYTKISKFYLAMCSSEWTVYQQRIDGNIGGETRARVHGGYDLPDQREGFLKFKAGLEEYINPYDKEDKAIGIGFIVGIERRLLENGFNRNQNPFLRAYFSRFIDVYQIASSVIDDEPETRTLAGLCKHMKVEVESANLHQADYDAHLTAQLYGALIRQGRKEK